MIVFINARYLFVIIKLCFAKQFVISFTEKI